MVHGQHPAAFGAKGELLGHLVIDRKEAYQEVGQEGVQEVGELEGVGLHLISLLPLFEILLFFKELFCILNLQNKFCTLCHK